MIFSYISLFFFSRKSDPACEANMRTEESDLRLRDRFHHQCHAYRSQSDASQWYEVIEWTNHNIDPIQHTKEIKIKKK